MPPRKAAAVTPRKFATVQLPSIPSTVLGAVAGVIVGLLQFKVFGSNVAVNNYASIAVASIGVFVAPITGTAFRKLFHFSAAVSTAIQGVIGVATVFSTQIPSESTRGVLITALAVAAFLGFGPSVVSSAGVTTVDDSKVAWR